MESEDKTKSWFGTTVKEGSQSYLVQIPTELLSKQVHVFSIDPAYATHTT